MVKKNEDNNFNDKKLTNINSITIKNNPSDNNHVSNKKYIDDELDKNTIVRLNDDSNDRYLQVRINNTAYNLLIYNKTQTIDLTKIIYPNIGIELLQNWKIICNNSLNEGKPSDFVKSSITSTPTGITGANVIPPIGNSFMYIETSSLNNGQNVYVSFERTDSIHISNITFYYNRYSLRTSFHRGFGNFDIQLLRDGSWETEFTIEKDIDYGTNQSNWTLLNINILSQPNYGIKLLYSDIPTAPSDMCSSDIHITHSIF